MAWASMIGLNVMLYAVTNVVCHKNVWFLSCLVFYYCDLL